MDSGTSMACPIVAGIIAQWMEAIPTLTREQVIEAFEATCRRHDLSLTYPNNDYGYGELDAEAGLNYLMDTYDGIQEIQDSRFQNPDASPAIYDLQGRKVNSSSHGIYIIVDKEGTRRKIHHSI